MLEKVHSPGAAQWIAESVSVGGSAVIAPHPPVSNA
jgi:hypothetical protein